MEKRIWFIGWNDENNNYNEVKIEESKIEDYKKNNTFNIDSLPAYVIGIYGQYAWDNMVYLQSIELVDENKGIYKMYASDPRNIYPETKGKILWVDSDKNIVDV